MVDHGDFPYFFVCRNQRVNKGRPTVSPWKKLELETEAETSYVKSIPGQLKP